ncbi:PSME3-interacting protein-like [Branchiostoma floridae]|uniref:PSME3-interacting protein-like n=1 Tax=Branchiostoma floridae TaxID=7739 RepID=A0A9J7LC03_BRAFL|nr:PSME3-interacting protein-like [Branchiostoma floridae]
MSGSGISFVTEAQVEETKKKRQEEWEKVRTADQPEECPEEEYDPRSLFDRLEEQKEKKQAEYEEQFKFKNQFRGLEEEETNFLGEVDNIRAKIERQKRQEEWEVIREQRKALELVNEAGEAATSSTSQSPQEQSAKRPTPKPVPNQPRKSQQALLAGAVKRKRSSSDDVKDTSSLPKATKSEDSSSHDTETAQVPDDSRTTTDSAPAVALQTAQVVAVLPGLGAYNYSSDSSDASSDESDVIEVVPILMKGCAGTAASKLAAGGKHQHHRH